jgi:predicted O-linked N-acetylglucosamine transferase (SPINDLY family)
LNPEYVEAHNNLGVALKNQGKLEEAAACYRRALELKPDYAEAHNNLGNALKNQGKLGGAIACYRRVLELRPDHAKAHNNLGLAAWDQGKLDEAAAYCRRALELKPDFAEAHNNLGNVLRNQGKLEEAVGCYRRALELKPDYVAAHSNLLLTLQYYAGVTPAALAEAHAEYDRRHAAPLRGTVAQPEKFRDRRGRLRLGFVSPDLGQHPVGLFLVSVLENLGSETICYSDRNVEDDVTHRLQAAATQWRNVFGMSDQRLAQQIRADSVDILFDLAGHTARNRLLVFARRPAAIQITWAGYAGTTGLKEMDYLLADRYEVPPGAERHYREQVLRMPDSYVCYDPPAYASPVTRLPALERGQVTLGCFNNVAKVTPQVVEVWAKILRRLPEARLVLKYTGWNDRGVARRYAELFAAHGIDPGRLEFLGHSPHAELLAEYNRIDLALDPFPYSGGLTTCEALWMGVPVVTCPGETFASRHSLSHLCGVGLTETIAQDLDEYVERAVRWASDLPRLSVVRAGLRARMAASPLCDGKRFATNLLSILRDVWQRGEPLAGERKER